MTQILASWRPEKAIFPNLKEIAFSAEKAIFPNMKRDAFLGRQNNLDDISSVLATWKSNFSEPERNRFVSWKGDFSEPERGRFLRAPEQPWRNFERLGDLKKQIFWILKKSLYSVQKAIFRVR